MYCPFYQVLDDIRKNDINIYTFPECDSDEDEEFKDQDKALKVSNTVNSTMPSFIGYLNNTVIKLPIYFNSQMHIDEQIIDIIPKLIRVFVQVRGAYIKHNNSCIVS